MMKNKITIAIDGYSSCGKSTLAKALSKKLNYVFIDSGAMYRGVALFCIQNSLIVDGEISLKTLINSLPSINLTFVFNRSENKSELYLNDLNVEHLIRKQNVANVVSVIASIKEVRQKLVSEQRLMGKSGGIIMDGRDIGSVVFPDAEIKLFITAAPTERVKRRYLELNKKGDDITLEEVKINLEERDFLDTNRKESPLLQTKDAILVDNTNLDQDQQLDYVLNLINQKF